MERVDLKIPSQNDVKSVNSVLAYLDYNSSPDYFIGTSTLFTEMTKKCQDIICFLTFNSAKMHS